MAVRERKAVTLGRRVEPDLSQLEPGEAKERAKRLGLASNYGVGREFSAVLRNQMHIVDGSLGLLRVQVYRDSESVDLGLIDQRAGEAQMHLTKLRGLLDEAA